MSLKAISVLLATLLLVGGGVAFYLAGQEPGPLLTVRQPTAIGGRQLTLELSVDSDGTRLSRTEARLEQGGLQFPLFSLSEPGDAQFVQENPGRMRITRVVATSTLKGLRDGPARVVVTAAHPVLFGMRQVESTVSRDVRVRLTPPRLSIASTRHYVNLGGAELVVYRVSPPNVASGVQVGERYYPGFAASGVGGAIASDPGLRLAFFALLFDQDAETPIRVVARDEAGNSTSVNLAHTILPGTFAQSRASVDDRFLRRVVAPILKATPDLKLPDATPGDRLAAFLVINGELRRKNSSQIETIGHETVPEMLWRRPFRRLGRAKPEAAFAEHRTYMYDGGEIDQQVHLGADLASTRRAPVTAANTGRVLFAAYLGIYGNCVIIDHGMGVQSLYAHLSTVDVDRGDRVLRGESIGRTGTTGLAGGDHLHFTVLVAGRPVDPIEWWDPHWIQDRIDRKLVEAGIIAGAPKVDVPKPSARKAPRVAPKPKPTRRAPAKGRGRR
jgi:murein DD-endopeptidase MepM/ murein hydrolase activator NlpD